MGLDRQRALDLMLVCGDLPEAASQRGGDSAALRQRALPTGAWRG